MRGGHERDLSRHSTIVLRLKFIDVEPYAGDEDDVWEPLPADGALIAAEATTRPRLDWHHA